VQTGEIFGLLGPNGAGKTSTLSAIEGLLTPDGGSVAIAGYDIFSKALLARANIGIQLQSTSFQQDLTIAEIIDLYASLYGVTLTQHDIDARLESISLLGDKHKRARELSGGQQQRLSLLIATIHEPPLILLDEPTSGLDPQSRRNLWDRIEALRDRGRGIVLTTHSMEEAMAVCNRVAIMDHGSIIATDSPEALIEKHKHDPDVVAVSRKGVVTLEDVFIGLTGRKVRA
jgi:ABC-2 type transport system ATP-binding protein